MQPPTASNTSRRLFLAQFLAAAAVITGPALAPAQEGTPGMQHRQVRRDDRSDRLQQRDDKWQERRDDPIGVRGPHRREDRRDLRDDRRVDRRERVY
jgi:hypothetical protein